MLQGGMQGVLSSAVGIPEVVNILPGSDQRNWVSLLPIEFTGAKAIQ